MKYLTDRREIAEAMNFGKHPVIRIDLETEMEGYPGCFEGDIVKVGSPNQRYPENYIRGSVKSFPEDRGKYAIMPDNDCLHSGFGYSDVIEELRYAQAQMLHAGETVVVVEDYPQRRACKVRMMKVSDRVRDFVYPACYLEDAEESV